MPCFHKNVIPFPWEAKCGFHLEQQNIMACVLEALAIAGLAYDM